MRLRSPSVRARTVSDEIAEEISWQEEHDDYNSNNPKEGVGMSVDVFGNRRIHPQTEKEITATEPEHWPPVAYDGRVPPKRNH